jgi:beta-phosphoglucomutase-like phosphatase (HAD superfamily)/GTP:adenosylcobinamide-phosphate guanylyltransferase
MNIIIPLCGKGERFKEEYNIIKPLVKVFDKEIILYILDNILTLSSNNKEIYIIINKNTNETNIINIINSKYKNINFINIENDTNGAVETVILGLKKINLKYNNILIIDGDNFYTINIIDTINLQHNTIVYFNDINDLAQYSYIKLNDNKVIDIIEKKKISDNANTGLYYFANINDFLYYGNYIINNNIKFNNEFYISVVIKEMLNNNIIFYGNLINKDNYISLGTPSLVNKYINNTYCFLFDLDGTLIISDHIYIEVWKQLLEKYNIFVNDVFYKLHIQGNSDTNVIMKLLPNCNIDIDNISQLKDKYFCENLSKINIIKGSIEFIKFIKDKGHKVAIVTNCNRITANNILKYININNFIDLLIIGSECKNTKPHPEPYLKAIEYFNTNNNKCFIFEDSNSGLLSAKGSKPKCIVGIDYFNNNAYMLKKNGANIIINNYDINLYDKLIKYNNNYKNEIDNLKNNIYNSLKNKFNIKSINIHNNNIKGGYISDVIKVDILLSNNELLKTILKKENKSENNLSLMVNKLQLYEREYLLYENIYNYLNINIPKFYGIIRDNNLEKIGIILENINNDNFILNLDLNKQSIDVILNYISHISKMHIKFMNKNLTNKFKGLYKQNSKELNNLFFITFINNNLDKFIKKWIFLLNDKIINKLKLIANKYEKIQNKLSKGILTLCHGDFKSPNIFYNIIINEPYFIDWQYICEGKGIQDIIFFMIESFDSEVIKNYYNIIINYYYNKIIDNNSEYNIKEYNDDITYSISYFPMLVAIWFGNINQDELIDKNFPFIFIKKFIYFIDNYLDENILNIL